MIAEEGKAKTIFLQAVEIASAHDRQAFIASACGNDEALRHEVEELLRHQGELGSFLESPAAELRALTQPGSPELSGVPVGTGLGVREIATVDEPVTEGPGTIIGPYKLLEQIGGGGFGVVFMAEQQQPIRRKVALKVIKPGMDTRQVIARFEAERQALALMDHPNIAKVLDAGQTSGGRPFFVMDLVKGMPVTEFCDQNQLSPKERLELFVHVCQAVQHAHQKGIIHRDIKPTNVLVTLHDGTPLAKVIDFGIAKALGQQLTDKTLFTGFAQMIGSPLYMAPEQAALSNVDVDTRSDIYSLGVLLYELLTGTTPFDKERLKTAGYDEMRRIIREEEPPKPSTRISTLGRSGLPSRTNPAAGPARQAGPTADAHDTDVSTIAAQRKSDPKRLSQLFRGELDWIVMKALEKDRNRRYESASALAADVQRYLNDEPVQACPPSAWYRMRKFARRKKAVLTTVALLSAGLALTIIVLAISNVLITHERDDKDQALKEKDAALVRARANEQAARIQRQLARLVVDRMFTQVAEKWLSHQTNLEPLQRQFLQDALHYYEEFTQEENTDPQLRLETGLAYRRLGEIQFKLGEPVESEKAFHRAIDLLENLVAEYPSEGSYRSALASAHHQHGFMLVYDDRAADAAQAYRQALVHREMLLANLPAEPGYKRDLALSRGGLAHSLHMMGLFCQAEEAYRRTLPLLESLPPVLAATPECRFQLAVMRSELKAVLKDLGKVKEARVLASQSMAIYEQLVADFPQEPLYRNELAWAWFEEGDYLQTIRPKDAEAAYRKALAIEEKLVSESPTVPDYRFVVGECSFNLGIILIRMDKLQEAEHSLRQACDCLEKVWADCPNLRRFTHGQLLIASWSNLVRLLFNTGRPQEAEKAYRHIPAILVKLEAECPTDPGLRQVLAGVYQDLGALLRDTGHPKEAEQALRKSSSFLEKFSADLPTKAQNREEMGPSNK